MWIKAYKILWWTIPILFLLILFCRDGAFDLQLHDTYFVVASWNVAVLISLLLGLLGGVYWIMRLYKLNLILSNIHSLGTSLSLTGIVILTLLQNVNRSENFELFRKFNSFGIVIILIFFIVQIIFITNIIIGLVKGKGEPGDNNR